MNCCELELRAKLKIIQTFFSVPADVCFEFFNSFQKLMASKKGGLNPQQIEQSLLIDDEEEEEVLSESDSGSKNVLFLFLGGAGGSLLCYIILDVSRSFCFLFLHHFIFSCI